MVCGECSAEVSSFMRKSWHLPNDGRRHRIGKLRIWPVVSPRACAPKRPYDNTRFANQSAWERGRKWENLRKWLGEGAKGLLNRWREKPLAPVQPGVAPVQTRVAHGARDSWETFVPWVQKTFCTLSRTTFGDFPIFDPSSRRSGCKHTLLRRVLRRFWGCVAVRPLRRAPYSGFLMTSYDSLEKPSKHALSASRTSAAKTIAKSHIKNSV